MKNNYWVYGIGATALAIGVRSCISPAQVVQYVESGVEAQETEPEPEEVTEQQPEVNRSSQAATLLYLEELDSQVAAQLERNHQARVFYFWALARANNAETGESMERFLNGLLDEYYAKTVSETRGQETYGGDAIAQGVTRPVLNDISAITDALKIVNTEKVPLAPQVEIKPVLAAANVYLNEAFLAQEGDDGT